eukprot:12197588-Ditylum_brightwellii.AAC.1
MSFTSPKVTSCQMFVQGGGGLLVEEIAELCQQGIEVDNNNEPAPENAVPPVAAMFSVGTWVTPT